MQAFADFSDSLLGGAILVALSITLGGVAFALLAVPARAAATRVVRARCATLIAASGALLACCQLASLGLKASVLAEYLGPEAYSRFLAPSARRTGRN